MVNVFVRDLDLGVVDRLDARRLEVVADGLLLFGGAQLAIGWHAKKRSRDEGRGCSSRSAPKESKDVPRTHWPGR